MKKNVKLVKSVLLLSILTTFITIVIGILGLMSIRSMNNNIVSIYEENLKPISYLGDIRESFLNIKLSFNKALIRYTPEFDKSIMSEGNKVSDSLSKYNKLITNPNERKLVNSFKKDFDQYVNLSNTMAKSLSQGKQPEGTEYNKYIALSNNMSNTLYSLNNLNIKEAENLKVTSDKTYNYNITLFLITICSVLLISIFISYYIIKSLKNSSKEIIDNLNIISKGDFSMKSLKIDNSEFGKMNKSLSEMIISLSSMLKGVHSNTSEINSQASALSSISNEMSTNSENVSKSIEEIALGTSSQSSELVEISSLFDEFNVRLVNIISNIGNIDVASKDISKLAMNSNDNMNSLIQSIDNIKINFNQYGSKINELDKNIVKINEITSLINSIADQTNLLALNAAIEAARAGEAGKGFSVVAEEIRQLAEQSKDSSQNIESLISGISRETNTIVISTTEIDNEITSQANIIETTIKFFKKIISEINDIIPNIEKTNTDASTINNQKNEILKKIENASSISQEISAASEEISATTEEMNASSQVVSNTAEKLSSMTDDMFIQVNKYKL